MPSQHHETAILSYLEKHGQATTAELHEAIGGTRNSIRDAANKMAGDGIIDAYWYGNYRRFRLDVTRRLMNTRLWTQEGLRELGEAGNG